VPEGIDEAREHLVETVQAAMELSGVDESRLLLGGFSQGAMLTVDTALRGLERPPAAACLYSGCLICEREWKPLAGRLQGSTILQSHGRLDPILPFQTGLWLRDMLVEAGCQVEFLEFDGMHTIPLPAIDRTAGILTDLTNAP
ncbi:MAG: lysophospholipase, partial [Planctomycetota bacterium]